MIPTTIPTIEIAPNTYKIISVILFMIIVPIPPFASLPVRNVPMDYTMKAITLERDAGEKKIPQLSISEISLSFLDVCTPYQPRLYTVSWNQPDSVPVTTSSSSRME